MEAQIDKLASLGTAAVQLAIEEYTKYFVVESIVWILFGVVCLGLAAWVIKKRDEINEFAPVAAVVLVAILAGSLAIAANVPVLFNPRAYAIHQLIRDAR